jgi:hypothetical protein
VIIELEPAFTREVLHADPEGSGGKPRGWVVSFKGCGHIVWFAVAVDSRLAPPLLDLLRSVYRGYQIVEGARMKITVESTTKIVSLDGMPCRVWEGTTEHGIPIHCFIPRIGVAKDQDASQFEAELKEQRTPSAEVQAIPLRMIL